MFSLIFTLIALSHLTVENRQEPLGLDTEVPRFSWTIESDKNDVQQTEYMIEVASSREKLQKGEADLWKIVKASSDNVLVPYAGKRLNPNQRCFWRVKVATTKGQSNWSEPQEWGMGLLSEANWKGNWIGLEQAMPWDREDSHSRLSARYYRTEFPTQRKVTRATLHICGLGLFEAYVNGNKVSDDVLTPAPTDYRKTQIYNSYDVTSLLKDSLNCLAVTVSNGRYYTMQQNHKPHKVNTFGYPTLRANLILEYADGKTETIATNYKNWRMTADGMIRSANEYDGEVYDARLEAAFNGWTLPGFDDSNWPLAERARLQTGEMKGNLTPPMRVKQTLRPVSMERIGDNGSRVIIDFGQNVAGWVRMRVPARNAGDTVTVRYAEKLQDNGELYVANLRNAESTDRYICSGKDTGTWAPRFVYHGFRYVEVDNYPDAKFADFRAEVVTDYMDDLGLFESPNDLLNKIYRAAYWGIVDNYKGMPTDCPQRDERQPWLGDRAMGCLGESYLVDNHLLYAKWLRDIEESMRSDGALSDVAPTFWNYYSDNVSWPSVFVFGAGMLYNQFGDSRPILQHYAAMKKWLLHFGEYKRTGEGLIRADKYGDWCVPPESPELIHSKDPARVTDGVLIGSAYYYHLLGKLKAFAVIAGHEADTIVYNRERQSLLEAFNRKYLHVSRGTSHQPEHILYPDSIFYDNNTVTANLLPLAFDMVPDSVEQDVARQVYAKILLQQVDRNGSLSGVNPGHLCCGVIGIQWLMRELSNRGRNDIAYMLAIQDTYPSWGYMIRRGATTIWELWNGDTANPAMNSANHVMLLGDFLPWLYECLGGLKSTSPGWKSFRLAPAFGLDELPWLNVSYRTPYGRIVSCWKKSGGRLFWHVEIPCNTTATLAMPDGTTVEKRSGSYDFDVKIPAGGNDRVEILRNELLFDPVSVNRTENHKLPAPSVHAATMVELPGGDLLAAYFGGDRESAPNVCIYTQRFHKGKWSAPQMAVDGVLNDTLRKACYNPVLFQVPGGDLLLFFKIGRNVKDWTGYVVRSKNGGKTWSSKEKGVLPDSLLGAIKNKPIWRDGKILSPSSKEAGGWRSYIEVSEDKGHTWRLVGPVPQAKGIGSIQPTLLEHPDGRLQMICRTRAENLRLVTSWSSDGGETWSPMEYIDVPSNNSGVDAVTLDSGKRFLLVHNPTHKVPGPTKPLRNPLVVSESENGLQWSPLITLEDSPVNQYSYPSAIVASDGTVHIIYTWRRQSVKHIQLKFK